MRRGLWIAFLFLTVGLVGLLVYACGSAPAVSDCLTCLSKGGTCSSADDGSFLCIPRPPATPTPSPAARDCRTYPYCPTHGTHCEEIARGVWGCVPDPTPTPTPTPSPSPTPSPTTTPTPTPTAPPPPSPPPPSPTPCASPAPCTPKEERVCIVAPHGALDPSIEGWRFGMTVAQWSALIDWSQERPLTECWDHASWLHFMSKGGASASWAAGVPGKDGDATPGAPRGTWLNNWGAPNAECTSKATHDRVRCDDGVTVISPAWRAYPPRVRKALRPCTSTPTPCATPTPGPTPSPSVPPSPQPGVACTPLSHIGVAFHAQHPAPNGPLGYRWVFSATPKSRKPFCPENRNECEQQAYQGDPVNDYANVVWRFDLRFQCQDSRGPLWNQQEPHTGSSWEPTDVRQENAYMANLKPAVRGLHRVRTCRRDAPTVCEITEKLAN